VSPISSQRFSKYSCVLFPDPSIPSTTTSAPGYSRLVAGAGAVAAASARAISVVIVAMLSWFACEYV
jgi:hypothetical protein